MKTEKYEVTKEQILEAHADACNEWKEKLEEWFPKVFEQKCEVGKWYWASEKAKREKTFLFFNNGKNTTYGFGWVGGWNNYINHGGGRITGVEATKVELEEVFTRELIRRYGQNWKNIKVKKCMEKQISIHTNTGIYIPVINTYGITQIWSSNGCLYKDGKWADVNVELLPRLPKELVEVSKSDIAKLMNVEVSNLKIVD
ncbi:hypothetical protein J2O09_05670 [Elizabethkingia anophelis]|uniref:hypothetical protein n=1 Tax=Elizabethkingia anophelis TaxID=1117645 RepID=UPI0020B684A8|nr:hypothetical protein [Elizabethkingia anophelis]UTG62444.1 hypothetical protein J2O09_05670 [Elizabethkingia anophelis]UXM68728.1 hypothetical protein N7E57_05685 [Elizabethkingia anophelis]